MSHTAFKSAFSRYPHTAHLNLDWLVRFSAAVWPQQAHLRLIWPRPTAAPVLLVFKLTAELEPALIQYRLVFSPDFAQTLRSGCSAAPLANFDMF
jgi:hypothetical protein